MKLTIHSDFLYIYRKTDVLKIDLKDLKILVEEQEDNPYAMSIET